MAKSVSPTQNMVDGYISFVGLVSFLYCLERNNKLASFLELAAAAKNAQVDAVAPPAMDTFALD